MIEIVNYMVFDKKTKTVVNTASGLTLCSIYSRWNNITTRSCRECPSLTGKKTYEFVEISDKFLDYAFFMEWFKGSEFSDYYTFGVNYNIDKDLLGNGTIYSEDVCVFIPQWLNALIPTTNTKADKRTMYVSVKRKNDKVLKYTAFLKMGDGKSKFVGGFTDPYEANKFAIYVKCETMKAISKNIKGFVSDSVIDVLENFDSWLVCNGYNYDPKYTHPKLKDTVDFYKKHYLAICENAKRDTKVIDHDEVCEYCKNRQVKIDYLNEIGVFKYV